jgi:hypothetical protein
MGRDEQTNRNKQETNEQTKTSRFRNNRISVLNFSLSSGITPPASSPGVGI